MATTITEIPSEFRAGQTFDVTLTYTCYPASTWNSTLKIRPQDEANEPADIAGVDVDDSHQFTAVAAATQNWPPGYYTYLVEVTDGSDVFIAEEGQIEILPSASAISGDQRSHNQIVLDNINAVLEKKATKDQLEYVLHDRSLKRYTFQDLLDAKKFYMNELEKEMNGGNTIRRVSVGFECP